MVTNPQALGPEHAATAAGPTPPSAGAVVLVGDARVLGAQLDLDAGLVPAGARAAAATRPGARGSSYAPTAAKGSAPTAASDGTSTSVLVHRDALWLLDLARLAQQPARARADNAALALRLLGQQPRWSGTSPTPADLTAGDGFSLARLLPPWLGPSAILLRLRACWP